MRWRVVERTFPYELRQNLFEIRRKRLKWNRTRLDGNRTETTKSKEMVRNVQDQIEAPCVEIKRIKSAITSKLDGKDENELFCLYCSSGHTKCCYQGALASQATEPFI